MSATVTDVTSTQIVDRYIESMNETDAAARRALIASAWTEDCSFVDPLARGEGHAGIEAIIAGIQTQFPGLRVRRVGDVDSHHDRLRFSWEFAPEGGDPLAGGVDFAILRDDRLHNVTGFLDFSPSAAGR